MKIRRGRIKPGFYAQRRAGREGLLQFRAQFGFADYFRAAFLDVGQLFVNRGEGRHRSIIRNCANWRGLSTAVHWGVIQLETRTTGAPALRSSELSLARGFRAARI